MKSRSLETLQACHRKKAHKKTIDEVELHPLPDECAIEHHARHEWNVIGSRTAMYATNPEHSTTAKVYSALHVIVLVERESDWHVRMIMCDLGVPYGAFIRCDSCPSHDDVGGFFSDFRATAMLRAGGPSS